MKKNYLLIGFILGLIVSLIAFSILIYLFRVEFFKSNIYPQDIVKFEDIKTFSDGAVINYKNLTYSTIGNTSSMLPCISHLSTVFYTTPAERNYLIKKGDIVIYNNTKKFIIHRIVDIKYDEMGKYFIVKGDNSKNPDNVKLRINDIIDIVVGVIY